MLQQRKPMKPGKGFQRKVYEKPPAAPLRRVERAGVYGGTTAAARPKEDVVVHESYRRLVRQLPCIRCGIVGFTQFCHADQGKGMGLKTDDRRGWPGCGPHGDDPGCHWLLGTSGKITRAERRRLEDEYAARTRETLIAMGLWPKTLAPWPI